MNTTKTLLEKFRVDKYNLISLPSIALSPEEADRFIDYIVDQSVLKQFARIERMNGPAKNVRAIGFGAGNFLYPAGQFNTGKYKSQFVDNKITLTTKKARGCVVIYDDDLEDVSPIVSADAFKNQIMLMVTKKIANELEQAYWIGDTNGYNGFAADDIRSIWDGWRWQMTHSAFGQAYYNKVTGGSHILVASDGGQSGCPFALPGRIAEQATIAPYGWEFKYKAMLSTLPSIYKTAGLANLRYLHSDLVTQDYIAALTARSTPQGDAAILGDAQLKFGKVPIVDVPLMPLDLGSGVNDGKLASGIYTDALLCPQGNLIIGIQRDIRIESQRVAADEATYVFYSLRTDVAVENTDAVVLVEELEHD